MAQYANSAARRVSVCGVPTVERFSTRATHGGPSGVAQALLAALAGSDKPETRRLLQAAAQHDPQPLAELLKQEADRQLFVVPGRSLPIAETIRQIGVLTEDPSLEALGLMTAADALRELGRYPDALREYERAGELYLSIGDEVGWARTRVGSAYTRAATVELGPALEEAERARHVLSSKKLWVRLARLESAMGNLLRELGRTQEALAAHSRAADAARRVTDRAERELVAAEVRINQAAVHQRLDQYEQAERLLRQAARTFRRHGRPGPVAIAEGGRARGLAAQGHVSRALALASDVRRATLAHGRLSHAAIFGQVAVECLLELNRPLEAASLADEIVDQLASSEAGVELAKSLLQRAVARGRLERYGDAAEDLARAQLLFRIGDCAGWAAVVRLEHAHVLERSGALQAALSESRQAGRELLGCHLVVSGARADLVQARVLHRLDKPNAARRAANRARAVARRFGVPLLAYQANRLLGELARDDRQALRAFAAAAQALEQTQGRILTEQRAGFLQLGDSSCACGPARHDVHSGLQSGRRRGRSSTHSRCARSVSLGDPIRPRLARWPRSWRRCADAMID